MLGNTRLLALCTSAALAPTAGCSPDSPTVAAPDGQLEQTGLGAGGHLELSSFNAGATQISGSGRFAGPAECNDAEGQGSDYDLIIAGDLEGCHYVFVESAECSPGGAYSETGTETSLACTTDRLAPSRRLISSRASTWIAPTWLDRSPDAVNILL